MIPADRIHPDLTEFSPRDDFLSGTPTASGKEKQETDTPISCSV